MCIIVHRDTNVVVLYCLVFISMLFIKFLSLSSPEEVKEHLQQYLNLVHKKFGQGFVASDMDLYLLCIKCMEV